MWFHAKINYKVQDNLGKWKSFAEQFLLENIIYGAAETDLATLLDGRVTGYEYDLTKVKFAAVYEPFNRGDFYKVTIEEKTTNELDKEKINVLTHYVIAESVHEAEQRTADYIKTWVTDCTIVGAVKTKILGVWHPHNSQWQDDFKQRMLKLAEAGQESSDANQTTIFDKDGKPKRYDEPKAENESAEVDLDQFAEATANYEATKAPDWKRAETARANDNTPWGDIDGKPDDSTKLYTRGEVPEVAESILKKRKAKTNA